MEKLNPNYSQADYARAVLRTAISSVNRKLRNIIYHELDGAELVLDPLDSVKVSEKRKKLSNYNPYNSTIKTLNQAFFFNRRICGTGSVVAQAYHMFGITGDSMYTLCYMDSNSDEPLLYIDPVLKKIFLKDKDDQKARIKAIKNDMRSGKISQKEGQLEINKICKEELSGEKYRQFISEWHSKPVTDELVKFLEISKQKSTGKIVEFMDIYSMYHYYIYRKGVNNRFLAYLAENPRAGKYQKLDAFEGIAKSQIRIHCESGPSPDNVFFDGSRMRLDTNKMHNHKAKKLTMELFEKADLNIALICDRIEDEIKVDNKGYKISIKDIIIDPDMYKKDKFFIDSGTGPTQIYANVRSLVKKMVHQQLSGTSKNLRKVEATEDFMPKYQPGAKTVQDVKKNKQRKTHSTKSKDTQIKNSEIINPDEINQIKIDDLLIK